MGSTLTRRAMVTLGAGAFAVLLLVALSPLALIWISSKVGDVADASALGETYGAAAAVLSALALCGVVASLTLQFRQLKEAQYRGHRERQFELLKMAIDDARLLPVLGGTAQPEMRVQEVYANLLLGHVSLNWDQGIQDERSVRQTAQNLFENPAVVAWWGHVKDGWTDQRSKRRQHFLRIFEQEYTAALNRHAADTVGQRVSGEAQTPERKVAGEL